MRLFSLLFCMSYCIIAHAQFSNVTKGDILEINGVKGIVFAVNEEGNHGTIMSVKVLRGIKNAWCSKGQYAKEVSTDSKTDGMKNTQAVFDYVTENNIDIKEFPAFAWCKQLGEGWYIPAISQLEVFINYWLGNDNELDWDEDDETDNEIDSNISQPKLVNRKLLDAGGMPFISGVYTSTENEKGDIYVYWYNQSKNWWKFYKRNPINLDRNTVGRAFYDF